MATIAVAIPGTAWCRSGSVCRSYSGSLRLLLKSFILYTVFLHMDLWFWSFSKDDLGLERRVLAGFRLVCVEMRFFRLPGSIVSDFICNLRFDTRQVSCPTLISRLSKLLQSSHLIWIWNPWIFFCMRGEGDLEPIRLHFPDSRFAFPRFAKFLCDQVNESLLLALELTRCTFVTLGSRLLLQPLSSPLNAAAVFDTAMSFAPIH